MDVPVVYVIQKSNKYGLKQAAYAFAALREVVYVIQKSNKYGLKQEILYKTLKHNQLSMVLERKKAVLSGTAFVFGRSLFDSYNSN